MKEVSESMNSGLEDKKLWVVECYRVLFDKESAYLKCGVTKEEAKQLDSDEEFQRRLAFYLVQKREEVVSSLETFRKAAKVDPSVLKATLEMGKLVYPEKFLTKEEDKKKDPSSIEEGKTQEIREALTRDDFAAEVFSILAGSGYFQSEPEDVSSAEIN